jgi:succinate dehydrogenase / fumarate reductase cytochrome b subunit
MTTSKRAAGRPLSPHLGIWRWSATMASSILHRFSGIGNAIGLIVVAWGLVALASGPDAFAQFTGLASSWLGRFVLFGFTLSISYHLLNGIRHLFWDAGKSFDVRGSVIWSWFNILCTVILAIGVWVLAYGFMGAFQ